MATTKPAPKRAARRPRVKAPDKAMRRVRAGEKLVTKLAHMDLPYSYGGGRSNGRVVDPVDGEPWTDCSGCATYVAINGYGLRLKNKAGSTWSLAYEGHPGESRYLTFYIKNTPGDEHIICRARKRPKPWHLGRPRYRYWQCGGSDNPKANGGPSWFIPGLKMGFAWKSRVEQFYIHRNFDDQLGVG